MADRITWKSGSPNFGGIFNAMTRSAEGIGKNISNIGSRFTNYEDRQIAAEKNALQEQLTNQKIAQGMRTEKAAADTEFARGLLSNPDFQRKDKNGNTVMDRDAIREAYGDRSLDSFNTVMGNFEKATGITERKATEAANLEHQRAMNLEKFKVAGRKEIANIRADATKSRGYGNKKGSNPYSLEGIGLYNQMDEMDAVNWKMQAENLHKNKGIVYDDQGNALYEVTPEQFKQTLYDEVDAEAGSVWPNWNKGDVDEDEIYPKLDPTR